MACPYPGHHCGSGLARDSGESVCQDVGRADVIASKLAPTLDLQWARNLCSTQFLLWEQSLLAKAVGQLAWMLDVPASSRASPLPHLACTSPRSPSQPKFPCGSELARDSGGSACLDAGCAGLFASKPAPTYGLYQSSISQSAKIPLWERACSRWRWVSLPGQVASVDRQYPRFASNSLISITWRIPIATCRREPSRSNARSLIMALAEARFSLRLASRLSLSTPSTTVKSWRAGGSFLACSGFK